MNWLKLDISISYFLRLGKENRNKLIKLYTKMKIYV